MIVPKYKKINAKNYILFVAIITLLLINYPLFADEQSISADGVSLVSIKSNNNAIKIFSWSESEISIKEAKNEKLSDNIAKIERKQDKIEINIASSNGFIRNYEVFVPEEIDINATSTNGSIYITGVKGNKKVGTINGNIELIDVVGSVSAKTVNGNIFADVHFDGASDFASVSGTIEVLPKDNFSVPININSVSGSINVILPSGYATDLDISTVSGQITSRLSENIRQDGRFLRGRLSGGGPITKIVSISGAVSIQTDNFVESNVKIPDDYESPREARIRTKSSRIDKTILPEINVTKTLSPPIIDGKLDDDTWEYASKIESFVWADGIGKPYQNTEVYMLWDDSNIYFGVKCYESDMANIKISATDRDASMWDDDNIQFMIDPTTESENHYYHIAINTIGTIYDMEVDRYQGRWIRPTKLGKDWSFGGKVDTDIRDGFWTIEISMPFNSFAGMKPKAGDIWRLNIHRMQQQRKEYTYWSPTYSTPDWPHVTNRFGNMIFSDKEVFIKNTQKKTSQVESAPNITKITIEGNEQIEKDDILKAIDLKEGDQADIDTLTRSKICLEALGWFENISMELIQNENGVELLIKVKEKDLILPSEVIIEGANLFTKDEIASFFNLIPSMTTKQDIAIKCKLIGELYKSKGYDMAEAECSIVSNTLQIKIDEGQIDEIEIHGNDKIRTKEILNSLTIKSGMPYRRVDIDSAINNMKSTLPYFRSVNWKPKKSEEGSNIVYIEVQETSLVKFESDGVFEFNRVHGLQLGFKPSLVSPYWGSKVYTSFAYGFSSDLWNYQFGMEKSFFRNNKTTFGFDIHKITDTNDKEIISDHENFFAEAILGEALRDYYQRDGFEVSANQQLPFATKIGIKYRDDEYKSLSKTNNWSLLNRFYANENKRTIRTKRENPAIREGRMNSIIGEISLDSRNNKKSATSGLYNRLSIEYAGRDLGGDYDFTIYQADIRSYNRLSRHQLFTFRVKAGTTDRQLPELHPKKFYLGGIGTLRGYDYKAFNGDKMVLMNAEYWLTLGPLERFGLGVFLFADSGNAWKHGSEMAISDLKTDIGVGFGIGPDLVVTFATPIEEEGQNAVISFRLSRLF